MAKKTKRKIAEAIARRTGKDFETIYWDLRQQSALRHLRNEAAELELRRNGARQTEMKRPRAKSVRAIPSGLPDSNRRRH
jgi:hypothetical protein